MAADNEELTPEQIAALVQEFVNTCGYNQYKGARYVPIFGRMGEDSIEWDNSAPYEPLTIVTYEGNSYTSRIPVPAGIDITNQQYWAMTGEFDARMEQLRRLVLRYQAQIEANRAAINKEISDRTTADTELGGRIDDETTARATAISALQDTMEDADSALGTRIDAQGMELSALTVALASEVTNRGNADTALQSNIDALSNSTSQALNGVNAELTAHGTNLSRLNFETKPLQMGGYIAPTYEGSFESDEQNASCLHIGDYVYTFSPNNYDSTGTVRVWDINTNSLHTQYNNVQMGHANSVAYDGTYIYLLPLNTYSGGTQTRSDKLYRYPLNMSGRVEMQLPSEHPYGVTYDWITQKLYYVDTVNDTQTLYVYVYDRSTETWSLVNSIANAQFAQTGIGGNIQWQDFTIYNDILYAAKLDGTTFMISLSPLGICGTFRIGGINSTAVWRLGEIEGLEFDSDGVLWNMRTFNMGYRNTGERYNRSIGIVTTLNTHDTAWTDEMLLFQIYGTLTVVSPTKFKLSRPEIHGINECVLRMDKYCRVDVPYGFTYTDRKVRIMDNLVIRVLGSMTISDTIEVDAGHTFLYVASEDGHSGTVSFTGSSAAIDASTKPCQISLRNDGTVNVGGNITRFVNLGYAPSLFAVNAMGNLTDITVNNTHVTAIGLCMGSYKVYGGNA